MHLRCWQKCSKNRSYKYVMCRCKMLTNSILSLWQLSHRLQPGEALTFNNRRVVHARTEYKQNGGQRLLEVSCGS